MALATPPSGRGVPSGVSQGGALEAHTETAKSPMRPRAVNYLPLPAPRLRAGANANATLLQVF